MTPSYSLFWCVIGLLLYHSIQNPLKKVIYYSPASIGDDAITHEIDFYTRVDWYSHQQFIPKIKELGATHILTSNRWDACKDNCHKPFLQLLRNQNLSLFISLDIILDENAAKGFKDQLGIVIKEFASSDYKQVWEGFVISAPKKASTDDWTYYFSFINELAVTLQSQINNPNVQLVVEFPISATNPYKTPLPDLTPINLVTCTLWAINIYTGIPGWTKIATQTYIDFWGSIDPSGDTTPPPSLMAIIQGSDYNTFSGRSNQTFQLKNYEQAFSDISSMKNDDQSNMYTVETIFEFSDEWWRGSTTETGFDVEGCPNSNPYAHTPCGMRIGSGTVLCMEYLGIYSIKSTIFQTCVVPKLVVKIIADRWGGINFNPNQTLCAPVMPVWISFVPFPFSVAAYIAPFVLIPFMMIAILCFPPERKRQPRTNKEKERDHEGKKDVSLPEVVK